MSTTAQWHASPALLREYAGGGLDAVTSASLERHVDRCTRCRAAVGAVLEPAWLDDVWDGVRSEAQALRLPAPLRWARGLGLPEPTAILLAAAASMRVAWLSSAIVALGFATAATTLSDGVLWPFLLVAPMIPVLGVAAAYPSHDEAFDALAVATPYGRGRLILVRTLAVLISVLPVSGVLGLFLPGPLWVAAAWFGPALALVPVMMALASFIGPRLAAPVVALAWCGLVLGSLRTASNTWPVEVDQQLLYSALALASLAILGLRSQRSRRIGAAL
ncbi:hypothetical protein [Nocardioides insulae]|uniref:hypothetical protein n=1 Tax=Nocardioides insulae TaxID=394734 RepID=UPI0004071873|nr:hypothetical protein [Nocardioides insulae]